MALDEEFLADVDLGEDIGHGHPVQAEKSPVLLFIARKDQTVESCTRLSGCHAMNA